MEQRNAIIISAALFAIVVAGSAVFLLTTDPNKNVNNPTPIQETNNSLAVVTQEETATPEPTERPIVEVAPTEDTTIQATIEPSPAIQGVTATAPTGPETLLIPLLSLMSLVGAAGFITTIKA